MIYFHNTYVGVGGAENLIFSVIKYASIQKFKIGLIGIDHGYLYDRLILEDIRFVFINDAQVKEYKDFRKEDILILFGNFYGIESLVNFPGNIAVWMILYTSVTTWNKFMFEKKIFKKNFFSHFYNRKIIKILIEKNSLFAMDGNVRVELNKYLGKAVNIPLIPIPIINISDHNQYIQFHKKSFEFINITYIGRGNDIWKIKPLKKVIVDLSKQSLKVKVHVFTDDDKLYLKEISTNNLDIYFHFGLYGKKLDEKLLELSDIHFSMGTAALEAAKLGIPTVLLDASFVDFPEKYKYNWLYNSKDFGLGKFLESNKYNEGIPIEQVINILFSHEQLIEISQKTINYVRENHSLPDIIKKLVSINPETKIQDILKHTPASWKLTKLLNFSRE